MTWQARVGLSLMPVLAVLQLLLRASEDDRRYVANIAAWLEQSSSSPSGKKVLIYTVAGGGKKDDSAIADGVADVLRQAKFSVIIQRPQPVLRSLPTNCWLMWGSFGCFSPNPGIKDN